MNNGLAATRLRPRPFQDARLLAAVLTVCLALAAPALAGTVLEEWAGVKTPPAPEARAVTVAPKTTALLVLDMQPQTCNDERRPRCKPTRAPIAKLIERARAAGMVVVYSVIRTGKPEDMFPEMGWHKGDPWVKSTVDKFLGTELENILKQKGVNTVILTGTAAQGAVLHTATAAAQRGMEVVVPVDALSAEDTFTEMAAVWALVSGPATRDKVTLTTTDKIGF